MFEFFARLFSPDFTTRQTCWAGNDELIRLHNVSDFLVGLAYMAIPFALVSVARRRRDLPFLWLFWMFGAFIISCGLTHFADVLVTYYPVYRLAGLVKLVTAVVSWATLLAMLQAVPVALALRSPAELEREVARRTRELAEANRALQAEVAERQRAEDALRLADRRKDEFLATLAHELRNPLSPVRNAAHLLGRPALPDIQAARLRDMIGRQVRHLARIVDDLLDVSRITHGKIELKRQSLDFATLVRDTAEDQRPVVEAGGKNLEVAVPAGPLPVNGDPTRLAQVLTNLLGNSAKYTDAGGRVTVRLAADGEEAVLTVEDTGIGMDASILPHVFETFVQADRSLDRSRGGLGLGLALVRGLVQMHGGVATADSDGPGRGSRFTVRLPLSVEAAPAPAPKPPAAGVPRRVLVVEDRRDVAESLRIFLELGGHAVRVAFTGAEGLTAARVFRPEVVLCDLGLPEVNGFELARALRADPETADVSLVAVTGYCGEDDIRRARAAGFDRLLAKPLDPADLEALLAEPPRSARP